MNAQNAPAKIPATSTSGSKMMPGKSASKIPTAAAPTAPMIICPSPPMLNLPPLAGMVKASASSTSGDVRLALNNSFGFGGNNCSLLFGRDGAQA